MRSYGFGGTGVPPVIFVFGSRRKTAGGTPAPPNPVPDKRARDASLGAHIEAEILELGDCRLLICGRKLAEPLNHGWNRLESEIDFFFIRLAAQAQAQCGTRIPRGKTERH